MKMNSDLFIPAKRATRQRPIPFNFVLEYLASAEPFTRPMFGCISVYIGEKIVMILRDKENERADNGVWIATSEEHHESLQEDFPSMRAIGIFGEEGSWRILPADAPDFEESVVKACDFILAGDPRLGKIPGTRKTTAKKTQLKKKKQKSSPAKRAVKRKAR